MVRIQFFAVFSGSSYSSGSFLLQDKVSEFAAMTPQQLFRKTQRAAGDESPASWHDTLISAGKGLKLMWQVRFHFWSLRM